MSTTVLCTLNKCSQPISQLSSAERLSASDLFIVERVDEIHARYPIFQEQHQQYTEEQLIAGDVVDAILLEAGTSQTQVGNFFYNEMVGAIVEYIHSNGKISYSDLSTRLLLDLSAQFGFNTMSTRDTWEYSRAGHLHSQYSDVRVFSNYPTQESDSQKWLGNFVVWQLSSGVYTSSEISVYTPKIEFQAFQNPDIGEVRFMGWPSVPTSTREDDPVHISVYQEEDPIASENIKVATWNIEYCSNHTIDSIANVLKAIDADVYCLQEVDKNAPRSGNVDQLNQLASKLGAGWNYHFTKTLDLTSGGDFGIGMLYKKTPTKISEYSITPIIEGDEQRALQIVEFANAIVANTHLASHGDESTRAQQAEFILEKTESLATSKPIWLCGDLNAREQSEVVGKLKSKFTVVSPTSGTTAVETSNLVIDYILLDTSHAQNAKKVFDSMIVYGAEDASDHYPVKVDASNISTKVILVKCNKSSGWWTYCNGAVVNCKADEFQDACEHFAGSRRATQFTLPKLNNFIKPNPSIHLSNPLELVPYENGLKDHSHAIQSPPDNYKFSFKGLLTIITTKSGGIDGPYVHSGKGEPNGEFLSNLTCYFDYNKSPKKTDMVLSSETGIAAMVGDDVETKPKCNKLLALVYLGEF